MRIALSLACLCSFLPMPAKAYMCTLAQDSGPSLSWDERTIPYVQHSSGTTDINGDEELAYVRASFVPWATASSGVSATNLTFVDGGISTVDRVGYDYLEGPNENLMIFRDDSWPHAGTAGQIIALTTVTFVARSGQIVDADVELNSANFEFTVGNDDVRTDLENTLVHEIGHMIGLAHSADRTATMYRQADTGDIDKRDLAQDDTDAVVFKYPDGGPNGYCTPEASCGFCGPPDELSRVATITVSNAHPDGDSGGCGATPTTLAAWIVLVAWWRRGRF